MATHQHTGAQAYDCPHCPGTLSLIDESWGCADCGYVPRHSAD